MNLAQLKAFTPSEKHLSTWRTLYPHDIQALIDALPQGKKRIRSYSSDGFVPSAYKWPCSIQYVEASRESVDAEWTFVISSTSAQRPNAKGNLLVIK